MRIEKQYATSSVRPGIGARIMLVIGFVVLIGVIIGAFVGASAAIAQIAAGNPVVAVSLNPGDIEHIATADSPVQAVPEFPSYGEFELTGLSADTLAMLATGHVLDALLVVVVAALAAALCLLTLLRRASWRMIAFFVSVAGAVLVVVGGVAAVVEKLASDDASAQILRADGVWVEPGFLAGIDPTAVLVGLVVLALAAAMRVAARYAEDTEGLV